MDFRWNEANVEHIGKHGVTPEEAEWLVRQARRPWPVYHGDGKYLVRGHGPGGRMLQVIYVLDEDDTIYVIHARPLTEREKRQTRRRSR